MNLQVDAPGSSAVSRELAELALPVEASSEGKAAWVALMTALPFGVAAAWMLAVAKSSQRTGVQLFMLLICWVCCLKTSCWLRTGLASVDCRIRPQACKINLCLCERCDTS
jgi:hypothetical protein